MKHRFKKITALLLAVTIAFSFSVTGMAADDPAEAPVGESLVRGILHPGDLIPTKQIKEDLRIARRSFAVGILKCKGKTIRDLGSDIRRRRDSRPEMLRQDCRGGCSAGLLPW